ncbi:DsbE family thiol:disulfide interchange protein [Salinisphaera sp. SPP-AMP-43]|uniref:DsbE family thiol:disulfide interchange protein n=1 Tax=Salinisphaera sp. SPP-AMP-43 TaxID=3121288 RepID=UPI003C6E3F07
MRWRAIAPVAVLLVLVAVLAYGLARDPHALPAAMVGKPAPEFELARLAAPDDTLRLASFAGRAVVVNVWASWCRACRSESVVLAEVARRSGVPIVGVNYKDDPERARRWLKRFGDPFVAVGLDRSGDTGIDWGVTGVPETFVIGGGGVIRDKIVGPVTEKIMQQRLLPGLQRLQSEQR